MRLVCLIVVLAITVAAGCGKGYQPAPPAPPKPAPQAPASSAASQPAPQPAQQSGLTGGMQAVGAAAGLVPLETAVGGPGAVAPARPATPAPAQPAPTYQSAQVGVGAKGQGYGGGLITTPVATYFRAQERIEFARIKHDLDLYKAAAPDNKGPRTHEEFMEKIIRPANIKLPDLPPGERYVYMPDKEELMVEHPPK